MSDAISVAVIDDDEAILDAVSSLLARRGMLASTFSGAKSFLGALQSGLTVDCILCDIRMPGMTGTALQTAISGKCAAPIIFITGHGDIDLAVRTMKAGAADFIEKPIDSVRLVKAIRSAAENAKEGRLASERTAVLRARYEALSERQREVMLLAAKGFSNKEIALHLSLSSRTVEHYREWVMEKMQAQNIAELVQMAMWLQLLRP